MVSRVRDTNDSLTDLAEQDVVALGKSDGEDDNDSAQIRGHGDNKRSNNASSRPTTRPRRNSVNYELDMDSSAYEDESEEDERPRGPPRGRGGRRRGSTRGRGRGGARNARAKGGRQVLTQAERIAKHGRKRTKQCENCGHSMMRSRISSLVRWAATCRACVKHGWSKAKHKEYVIEIDGDIAKETQEAEKKLAEEQRRESEAQPGEYPKHQQAGRWGKRKRKDALGADNASETSGRKRSSISKVVKTFPLETPPSSKEVQGGLSSAVYFLAPDDQVSSCKAFRDDELRWDDSFRTRVGLLPLDAPVGSKFFQTVPETMFRLAFTNGQVSQKWGELLDNDPEMVFGKHRTREMEEALYRKFSNNKSECGGFGLPEPSTKKGERPAQYTKSQPVRMGYSIQLGNPRKRCRGTLKVSCDAPKAIEHMFARIPKNPPEPPSRDALEDTLWVDEASRILRGRAARKRPESDDPFAAIGLAPLKNNAFDQSHPELSTLLQAGSIVQAENENVDAIEAKLASDERSSALLNLVSF